MKMPSPRVAIAILFGFFAASQSSDPAHSQSVIQPKEVAHGSCSIEDLNGCSSCAELSVVMSKTEDRKALSKGKYIDGVLWTPLYAAYSLNCQDIGRALVRRGANVNLGGKRGALLVEVSGARANNPGPGNSALNRTWMTILEGGQIDIDAKAANGLSGREGWADLQATKQPVYSEIWAELEAHSVSTTVAPDDLEFDPDRPTGLTGKTRPAESPVAKGVEQFSQTFLKSGMAGVSAVLAGCYRWALQISKPTGRRVALENCAGMDIAANAMDVAARTQMNFPAAPYFEPGKTDERVNQIRSQGFDGLVYTAYRGNLEASAIAWLNYYSELQIPKDAPALPPSASSAQPSAPPRTDEQLYHDAFKMLQDGNYVGAEQAFRLFVQLNADHPLAGNAQYWLGETYFARKDYQNAIAAFAEGYRRYPSSPKGPDNLLKLGITFAVIGRYADACRTFSRFEEDYPRATELQMRRLGQERQRDGCR
jgi:tol-pal system protein YbgF